MAKKVKKDEQVVEIPKTIMLNFINNQNVSLGTYDIPLDAGPKDFQEIVSKLLP